MRSAFRYRDVEFAEKKKRKEKTYLAFYPMEDLAFTQGDEFRSIRVKSPILPDTGIIYDLAEMDVRYNGLVHKTESKQTQDAAAPCLIVFGVEPGNDISDSEVEKWFKEEVWKHATSDCTIILTRNSTYQRPHPSKAMFDRRSITCSMHAPMLNRGH